YLHCDPTMSHYLKTTMDCIFGEDQFRNEIVWYYRGAGTPKLDFARRHDIIFRYASDKRFFDPDPARQPYAEATKERFSHYIGNVRGSYDFGQQELNPKGKHPDDVICDIQPIAPSAKARLGYPTQKPLPLLDRIIQTSSHPNDIVLDPFCGCATTCVAAERLGRKWVGVDVSHKAFELVTLRLTKEAADPDDLLKKQNEITLRTDPPVRTDQGVDYRETKFVYIISHPKYPSEYKVGIAKDWKSRLNTYQTADPERAYKVEYKMETPHFRELEKHIHETFPNKHEWVQAELTDIKTEMQSYQPEQS
ncbi:MAG: DNA methyltransferase, partial [Gammaproteobacteria bacterium]|nr:DNA methyltransferase [Gammaproteobacteria bacterium]